MDRRAFFRASAPVAAAVALGGATTVLASRPRARYINADNVADRHWYVVLDGHKIEYVREALEGAWLVALARDRVTGQLIRVGKWGDGQFPYRTVKVHGDVRLMTQEEAQGLPKRRIYA